MKTPNSGSSSSIQSPTNPPKPPRSQLTSKLKPKVPMEKNKAIISEDKSEIAFFDLETTVPNRPGQGFAILEFGAILVCPRKLEEKWSYSTLIRPANPALISSLSVRCNGITPDAVVSSPSFSDIADTVFEILHGRIWAGHNIARFDCVRIKEAFGEIGRQPPEPKGILDSLAILTHRFGRRAGDMKMATLATYFGLGKQTHRSLDDVRMNLEVLKCCATVLFLESSLPEAFPENSWVSPNATTRSRRNGKLSPESKDLDVPSTSSKLENIPVLPVRNHTTNGNHPILSFATSSIIGDPFDLGSLGNEMNSDSLRPDVTMEEKEAVKDMTEIHATVTVPEGCSSCAEFVEPDEVSLSYLRVFCDPYFRGSRRMKVSHKDVALQLYCPHLRVRFGLSTKFVDHAGRPRLSFVVNASLSLCRVLDFCDEAAKKVSVDSGSSSDWRHVVSRKDGFKDYPTVRLHIPTAMNGDIAQYETEFYQKEPSGSLQKLVFSKFDATELDAWISPGKFVDAFLSVDSYDYQQNAGLRLVAKKLVIQDK